MKCKLKDICTITKGAVGIMKAIPGKYPLVALSDKRRSHNEFQFDTKAVIVPLISNTGHGHASMKRVHYQEGKFALGNILCAVIPKDEKQLNAKYLHLYLQQFKETLLVPLMRGAANVSLPMNKLGEVEIEVPSLQKQTKIISLAEKATHYKIRLENNLISQSIAVTKLRQVLIKEALKGKHTKQNIADDNASSLLIKIKDEKLQQLSKRKLPKDKTRLTVSKEEINFKIPKNWVWCRLGDIIRMNYGKSLNKSEYRENGSYPVYGSNGIIGYSDKFLSDKKVIIIGRKGSAGALQKSHEPSWATDVTYFVEESDHLNLDFIFYLLISLKLETFGKGVKPGINRDTAYNIPIPLPPLAEQSRIVSKLDVLMLLCNDLQNSINQSNSENDKLLQSTIRDALKASTNIFQLPMIYEPEEKAFLKRKILANYLINQSLEDNKFGDVKFEKLLHLCEYHGLKRNLNQKYLKKAAGPFDNKFTYPYFQQIEKDKLFIRRKVGQQYIFKKGLKHSASEKYYNYFSDEELKKIDKIINYFKSSSYEPAEIISTLYAVWNNRIISGEDILDELLIADFYNWDTSKKRYKEDRLYKALDWMRKNEFVPDGWGNVIERKNPKK